MTILWILLAFWIGAMLGFGLNAALTVSREQDESDRATLENFRFSNGC
jgi:hypothetical protein